MAQLKDTAVQGSLRVTDTTYTTNLNLSSGTASQIVKTDANKNLITGTLTTSEIPTLSITDKTSGTLTVARGGTGATSFTANSLIISGNTTTAALTTRAITDRTSVGALTNVATWANSTNIPTVNLIAYWDGRYQTTNNASNLAYCKKGAFGDMAIKTKGNGFSDSSNTISVAYGTAANTAVQGNATLVTLNGTNKTAGSLASFYAPTGGGTAGYVLIAGGNNTAPSWYAGLTLAGSAAGSYIATFAGTTDATSSTGSVIISGGLLVKKKLYVTTAATLASTLGVSGATTLSSTLTVTGASTFNGNIVGSSNSYGDTLPSTNLTTGRIFFQTSDPTYELPIGGSADQALVKNSNSTRDVTWADIGVVTPNNAASYYVTGSTLSTENTDNQVFNTSIYVTNSVLMGAAWNDYAEFRASNENEPGRCVIENGDGTLSRSTQRLQAGAEIISDTFGFAIGKTKEVNAPIACSGRVLAYPYENKLQFQNQIGKPVCSGPNGTVSIMTEEEEMKYPSRIIGTISEVPSYEEWGTGKVKVNGRVWIRIR